MDINRLLKEKWPSFAVSAALVCFFTVNFMGADKIFGLVIADTAITNNYLWNIVTCLMYEKYIAKLICDVALLFVVLPDTSSFKYGPVDQFSLYMGVCLSCCSLGTAGYCFIRFFSTGAESMLFIPVYGFSGILVILSMFVRAKRGNVLISASVPYISYNNLPVLLVAVDMLCWFIRMGWLVYDIPFALIGLCISWSYLRFYYRNEDSENSQYHFDPARVNGPQIMWFTNVLGSKGNFGIHAEEFSFVNMFPAIVYPFVVPLTTAFYNLFVLLGIFPETADSKEGTHYKHAHHLRNATTGGGQGAGNSSTEESTHAHESEKLISTAEAVVVERRRAKAMKLLDAKLADISSKGTSSSSTSTHTAVEAKEEV